MAKKREVPASWKGKGGLSKVKGQRSREAPKGKNSNVGQDFLFPKSNADVKGSYY